MIHNMKINDSAFKRMNNGTKVREYRMNDDPYKVYREYRDSVSDHLPIVIELEIRK